MSAVFDERVARLDGSVVYFPVRHHSPAAARLLGECVTRVAPKALLIEGPADFNPQFVELFREHVLPIAIYSYVRLGEDHRLGAFYPFCEYSPEWQAIAIARDIGTPAEFIDLPWAELAASPNRPIHRYADGGERRSNYLLALTHKLGLEDYDDCWDQFFEVDPALSLDQYLADFHRLLFFARATNPGTAEDRLRERFMAARIESALERHGAPLLVITGGFHSYPLYCRQHGLALGEPEEQAADEAPAEVMERGIALTPYSYERLDSLQGYDAGMPNPGFYHRAWTLRSQSGSAVYRSLLAGVAAELRKRKQAISTADLIASESLIRSLATLRGHARPWRRDLVDGVRGALVKDDLGPGGWHPVLDAMHQALRGDLRGRLASGTRLPPLVADIERESRLHDVLPERSGRTLTLDLTRPADLARARTLHRLSELGIAGYTLVSGGDLAHRDDVTQVIEQWNIRLMPEYEATCIEASLYGPALAEASLARLEETAAKVERSAATAARILMKAALMGHFALADRFSAHLGAAIREDGEFASVAAALNVLLYLYRYDDVIGAARQAEAARLLREAYQRGLWLVECMAQIAQPSSEAAEGIKLLKETLERCGPALGLDAGEFLAVFTRVGANAVSPLLRGAATGVLWSLAAVDVSGIHLPLTANPEDVGDYLTGLFALARYAVQRHGELLEQIDTIVAGWNDEQFLVALPPLRLAFSVFTPREKDMITGALFGNSRPLALAVPDAAAAEVLAWEGRLFGEMARFGVEP